MQAAKRDPRLIAANLVAKRDKAEMQLKKLLDMIDSDGSGKISYGELEKFLNNVDVSAAFEALDLEVNDAWTLFKLLDQDRADMINIQEFIFGCKQLSGGATTDIAKLTYEVK